MGGGEKDKFTGPRDEDDEDPDETRPKLRRLTGVDALTYPSETTR